MVLLAQANLDSQAASQWTTVSLRRLGDRKLDIARVFFSVALHVVPRSFRPHAGFRSANRHCPARARWRQTRHELTAAEEKNATNWAAIEADADFKRLLASKARFIIPATLFFIVYYFTLPVLVGWFPKFMEQKVVGEVNLAYLFALSQFFMAWIIAFLYLAAAAGWDRQAAALLSKFTKGPRR